MATIHTLIDYDRQNPTAISREQYTNVGADAFSPGTFPRAFNDLEVWDAVTAGNQLVIDVDYELVDVDLELSSANYEDEAVYKTLRVINATYQVGSIWLTYEAIGTYPTALLHDPTGLPAAGALDGTEPITTVQSGEMVKATASEVAGAPQVLTAKAADYTILDDNLNVYEVTTAAVDRTLTLPTLAANLGRVIECHKVDTGVGKLTVDGEGAEAIDGNASIVLPSQYNYLKVRAGTAGWHVLEMKANYDTGWVDIAGAVDGSSNTITHNLGLALGELIVTVSLESDGGKFTPITLVWDWSPAATVKRGIETQPIDDNSFTLQFGAAGMQGMDASGELVVMNNADTTAKYRAVLYRLK